MINKFVKMKCRKCLYNMGIIKSRASPCISCKVNGGDNPPFTVKSLSKEKASANKKNRR